MAGDSHSNSTHQQQAMLMYKSYRIPSDMDSQISLPRSYTLPREFKYYRRPKSRKAIRSEHFVASTNSSDGRLSHDFQNLYTYKRLMLVILLLHMLTVRVGSSYEQEQEMAATNGTELILVSVCLCSEKFVISLQIAASLGAYCYSVKFNILV